MLAAYSESSVTVKALLGSGAKVDLQDTDGMTALMLAVKKERVDHVKLLMAANADREIKDHDGLRALDYAVSDEMKGILEP